MTCFSLKRKMKIFPCDSNQGNYLLSSSRIDGRYQTVYNINFFVNISSKLSETRVQILVPWFERLVVFTPCLTFDWEKDEKWNIFRINMGQKYREFFSEDTARKRKKNDSLIFLAFYFWIIVLVMSSLR